MKKTAQEIQDEIFKKMLVEQKIKLASSFWSFAKQMAGDRIYHKMNGISKSLKKNR